MVYISPVFPGLINIENIFIDLKDKTKNIYFENYNTKQGTWPETLKTIKRASTEELNKTLSNQKEYSDYWNSFIDQTKTINTKYGFNIKHFIHPFDSYY